MKTGAMVAGVAIVGMLAVGWAVSTADEVTLTGSIGDAMCGVTHMMDDKTACARGCVLKGSDFALIVDDTAYTLQTSSDETKARLDELAGQRATVTGEVSGETIQVTAVEPAERR